MAFGVLSFLCRGVDNRAAKASNKVSPFYGGQKQAGGHSGEKTRDPIPNSAVKVLSADGTLS